MSVNFISTTAVAYLSQDAKIFARNDNKAGLSFNIAINSKNKNADALFHRCVMFYDSMETANKMAGYLKKGTLVSIVNADLRYKTVSLFREDNQGNLVETSVKDYYLCVSDLNIQFPPKAENDEAPAKANTIRAGERNVIRKSAPKKNANTGSQAPEAVTQDVDFAEDMNQPIEI